MGIAVVVGATGFVGSYIVKQLLNDGHEVRATCRNIELSQWVKAIGGKQNEKNISLYEFEYGKDGKPKNADACKELEVNLISGADAVFFCVGYEKQEPETITYMINACLTVLQVADSEMKKTGRKITVVVSSSTGSTNPPNAPPDMIKDEINSWSNPDVQKERGKFSPAAKTLMELAALEFVGRNKRNEIIDKEKASNSPRLCIMNPSLILAPQLKPGEITGNGLPWFAKIATGDAMNEQIPNDSMSIIHCEDLAALNVLCAFPIIDVNDPEPPSGRFFGVNQSWSWEEILCAIKSRRPNYNMPPKKFEKQNPVTKFDNTRRDRLGLKKMKSLTQIMNETITYLEMKGVINR